MIVKFNGTEYDFEVINDFVTEGGTQMYDLGLSDHGDITKFDFRNAHIVTIKDDKYIVYTTNVEKVLNTNKPIYLMLGKVR